MGEKGNLDSGATTAAHVTSGLVERTTTTVVSSVSDTGTQLAETIRDASVKAIADETVAEGRARLTKPTPIETPPDVESS